MAGHSHSANIARRKGAVDKQRAREFNKCAKALQSAVRTGGADPSSNLKLRYAIEKARAANMPKDNIERVIKRASGEGNQEIEELVYEGLKVALVTMPEGSDFRGWYPPGSWAAIKQFLNDLEHEFEVPWINARDWVADDDFSDSHHLLPTGATVFTQRLWHDLIPTGRVPCGHGGNK